MNKNIFAITIAVVLVLALAGQVFPYEANATVQVDAKASRHQALMSGEPSAIEIANLSCQELSALGSAVNTVLDRETKLDNIRKIAAIRAQDLASEAQYVGGLFKGPVGFFRRIFSDFGWIDVEPPENIVTLSIDEECVLLGLSVTATDLATMFFGQLGGAVTGVLSELAKWAGTEIGTKTVLQDIGYAEVKSDVGIMTIIYDREAEVAWVNIDLEDLQDEWKESYGYQSEHIYMYVPFEEEPPNLKKTGGGFDYRVVFKGEAITKFKVGTIVKVINTGDSGINVRDAPAGTIVKNLPDGWKFRVIGGPQPALLERKMYIWWKVCEEEYEISPIQGWVAEEYLDEVFLLDLVPSPGSANYEYFVSAQDRIEEVTKWAKDKEGSTEWYDSEEEMGYCLRFVREAFGGQPIPGWTAAEAARQILKVEGNFYPVENCWNPPKGALVFFSATGAFETLGHVGIYVGDNEVVHAFGSVKIQGITKIEQLGGMDSEGNIFEINSYIGWAYPPEEWLDDSNPIPVPALSHPWPMSGQNAQKTYCSPYMGPESTNTRLLVEFDEPGLSGCLVSADGTVYINRQNADAMSIIAIKPNGSHKEIIRSQGVGRLGAIGPGGTLYIMLWEENKGAILALDAEGTELWRRSLPLCPDKLTWPKNILIGADGIIYAWVRGNEASSLTVFSPDGTELWSLLGAYSGLAIAEHGTVYSVVEEGKVCAYDGQGEKKWEYDGRNDWSVYYDRVNYSIAIGPDSTVFILPNMSGIQDASAGRLIALTPTLKKAWHVDIPVDINSEYEAVYGPAIAPDGSLYILEGNNLFKISPDGKLELFAEGNFYPKGPIVDAAGTVYIAESAYTNEEQPKETGQVIALNTDGSEKWRTSPLDFGHIWPDAIGADGTIYARGEHWVSGQGVFQPIIAIEESSVPMVAQGKILILSYQSPVEQPAIRGLINSNLWAVDPDTGNRTSLPDRVWNADKTITISLHGPCTSWSKDGGEIAHLQGDDSGVHGIFIINRENFAGAHIKFKPPVNMVNYCSLSWSPDGTKVAFNSFWPDNALHVVDINSGQVNRILQDAKVDDFAWSPDSTRIVFSGGIEYGRSGLFVIDSDGGNREYLSSHGGRDVAWSPGGSEIAFISYTEDLSVQSLSVLNLQDGQVRELFTSPDIHIAKVLWSPDGNQIAFSTYKGVRIGTGANEIYGSIYVVNSDGGNLRTLIREDDIYAAIPWMAQLESLQEEVRNSMITQNELIAWISK